MPGYRRRIAALVTAAAVTLGAGGCSFVSEDADGTRPSPNETQPQDPQVIEGRAWRRGRRRLARVVRARWSRLRVRGAALVPGLDARSARALARSWARAGEFEHASVQAFVALAADLRTHGAPADLVRRCETAADQERDHTTRCFALATRYARRRVEPGPVGESRPAGPTPSLAVIAAEALRDGVTNEGVAALLAAGQLELCTDAMAADTLAVIARDEASHAELGWSVLAWCLETGGDDVRRAVAATPASLAMPRPPAAPAVPFGVAEAHGRAVPVGFDATLAALRCQILGRLDSLDAAERPVLTAA